MPPLLKDQAWGVHAQEAFLLFCLALGECFPHQPLVLLGLDVPLPNTNSPFPCNSVLFLLCIILQTN